MQKQLAEHVIVNQNRSFKTFDTRWKLYWIWVKRAYDYYNIKMNCLLCEYKEVQLRINQCNESNDLSILKEQKIVGMTTTGAAKHFQTIDQLGARIGIYFYSEL